MMPGISLTETNYLSCKGVNLINMLKKWKNVSWLVFQIFLCVFLMSHRNEVVTKQRHNKIDGNSSYNFLLVFLVPLSSLLSSSLSSVALLSTFPIKDLSNERYHVTTLVTFVSVSSYIGCRWSEKSPKHVTPIKKDITFDHSSSNVKWILKLYLNAPFLKRQTKIPLPRNNL